MKRQQKKQLLELMKLLSEAHDSIIEFIQNGEINNALECLAECQNTAIFIGNKVDENEGSGTTVVKVLEGYCEFIYKVYDSLSNDISLTEYDVNRTFNEYYEKITSRIKTDISEVKEIVFLPYKASMWDSFESVWKKLRDDPCNEVKVIPIPYYDKNPDGTFSEMHYEGKEFPNYVTIIHYNDYNFEDNHPDEIYIHNPYDDSNLVTSVHPFFYSKNIKLFTDKLVYIPYFVLDEFDYNNEYACERRRHFAQVPAVIHAHEVIVQSEKMRQFYVDSIVKLTGEDTRKYFEEKIKGTGSPKIEKVRSMTIEDIVIPEEWNKYLYKQNGERKKVVLYNTSVSTFLRESEFILKKIKNVFDFFEKCKDDVVVLWRPHPLMEATVRSMKPQLWEAYQRLVEMYLVNGIGIYDDTTDLNRAIVLADAYYGDLSSLVALCKAVNMPVMIQNVKVQSDN